MAYKQIDIFDVIEERQQIITKNLYYEDLGIHFKINLKANNRPFSKIFYSGMRLHSTHYRDDYDNLNRWRTHISLSGNKLSPETLIYIKSINNGLFPKIRKE